MEMFGLNDYTGIEIEESKPIMASPEVKKQSIENYYENPTASQKKWSDGDSIRCAIGQSYNSYSVMNIAKYTPLTWWILAKILKYRECHRKLD